MRKKEFEVLQAQLISIQKPRYPKKCFEQVLNCSKVQPQKHNPEKLNFTVKLSNTAALNAKREAGDSLRS
jgi:hypothetical protein